jgi:uncharacterized protein YbaR (Trm112 family)
MDKELLEILCCPQTRQDLRLAEAQELSELNAAISRGIVVDAQGRSVKRPIEAALVRQDGLRAYPVRDGIPVLLVDEAMILEGIR